MDTIIVGFGKLGKALAFELLKKNRLYAIVSQHLLLTEEADQFTQNKVRIVKKISELEKLTGSVFICSNDEQISKIVKEIAINFRNELVRKIIIHCSGIHSHKILDELKEFGAYTASAHPLQTFYYYHSEIFQNIYWIVQSENFEQIEKVLKEIGGNPILVDFDERQRAIYHTSAVVSSNFLNSLLLFARKLITQIPLESKVLIPLIEQTLKNNLTNFTEINSFPLTGPIVRKDFATIRKHIDSLSLTPNLQQIYLEYLKITLLLCKELGILTDEEIHTIEHNLNLQNLKKT